MDFAREFGLRPNIIEKDYVLGWRLGPAAGYFPRIIEEWDNTFIVNTLIRGM